MSWICKRCETENPDKMDVCEVCDTQAPRIIDLSYNKIIAGNPITVRWIAEFCDNIAIINQGEVVLAGELKEIKKDYSKNRLMLSAENYTLDELAEKVGKELKAVSVSEKKKEFLEIL